MKDTILILDFGSQYTQLIARTLRECKVYCEIVPYHAKIPLRSYVKGIILSGSPASVHDASCPLIDIHSLHQQYPILGICYGAQLITTILGGQVTKSTIREYGRAILYTQEKDIFLENLSPQSQVWMSHADTISLLPQDCKILCSTDSIPIAAFKKDSLQPHLPLYGLQFHPEVYHSTEGKNMIYNFAIKVCGCKGNFTPMSFIEEAIQKIKEQVGDRKVIMAISGGVDSTVAATLIHQAIGKNLYSVFVDNGLLRKNEFEQVLTSYKELSLNVIGVDAKEYFYQQLKDIHDPEEKRKNIGNAFVHIFNREATQIEDICFLGQGTIYPDVIESTSVHGPSQTIKSHHNVGGLPTEMNLTLVEPIRYLFKDEVRKVGEALHIPLKLLYRHPFPGPGLAIRIIGDVTKEKIALLQKADKIFIDHLIEYQLYEKVWQAATILLPIKTVGVMGDERSYEYTVALRAVTSVDGMTADWAHLPHTFLASVSNAITNQVKGINRVVYDISSKPPATIEWE